MPVPENAQAIWSFLTGQGFNANAAAGIEGNIEQESGGDPTAGSNPPGAGLIQILGDSGGSLSSELQKTMAYIKANGSVSDINSNAASPAAAALYFSQKYERPDPALANNANRENSAEQTFQAAQSGNWPANASSGSSGSDANTTGILSNPLGAAVEPVLSWVGNQLLSKLGVTDLKDAMERLGLILLGVALVLMGLNMLGHSVVSAGSSPSGAVKTEDTSTETTEKRAVAKGAESHTAKTGAARAVEAAAVA